jgi:hypothetical protein
MTSRQSQRYGPMVFDAGDVTDLKKKTLLTNDLLRQIGTPTSPLRVPKGLNYLTPGEYLGASMGQYYCVYARGFYCKLPTIMASPASFIPVSIP